MSEGGFGETDREEAREAASVGRDARSEASHTRADQQNAQAQIVVGSIKRSLNILIVATVLLYLGNIAFNALYVLPQARKANNALCTFRNDLATRVVQTQEYIRDHPEGFPGVPAASLQQSLAGQVRTIASLSSLNCDDGIEVGPITPPPTTTVPKN